MIPESARAMQDWSPHSFMDILVSELNEGFGLKFLQVQADMKNAWKGLVTGVVEPVWLGERYSLGSAQGATAQRASCRLREGKHGIAWT